MFIRCYLLISTHRMLLTIWVYSSRTVIFSSCLPNDDQYHHWLISTHYTSRSSLGFLYFLLYNSELSTYYIFPVQWSLYVCVCVHACMHVSLCVCGGCVHVSVWMINNTRHYTWDYYQYRYLYEFQFQFLIRITAAEEGCLWVTFR